ncbi:MAG: 16S rRNA (uracil(1498)-N(3))-methyltransferase [Clostridia bacterium]|nr:16S rRNA (uracil(1498)-N(3))-methyltransferase [Clostridia bacterium]
MVQIEGQEAQHLLKVRRCKIGDEIVGFNGDGIDYSLKVKEITKQYVLTEIIDKKINRVYEDVDVTVYLAMIKNDALSTALDNLAELNVKTVKLFRADRSIAVVDEKKLEKLRTNIIQASKQSERADIMNIEIIDKTKIEQDTKDKICFFAYEDAQDKMTSFDGNFSVIIGPEGGFTTDEVKYFSSFAKTISISKTILRAHVACVSAVSALRAVNNAC